MIRTLLVSLLVVSTTICTSSNTDYRPWGYYTILADSTDCKIKRLVVYPHKRLSLQRHKFRAEHWIILQGEGLVTLNNQQIKIKQGSTIHVKPLDIHRVENTGDVTLEFIEVQTGTYFG